MNSQYIRLGVVWLIMAVLAIALMNTAFSLLDKSSDLSVYAGYALIMATAVGSPLISYKLFKRIQRSK